MGSAVVEGKGFIDLRAEFLKEMCKIKVFECGMSLAGPLGIC